MPPRRNWEAPVELLLVERYIRVRKLPRNYAARGKFTWRRAPPLEESLFIRLLTLSIARKEVATIASLNLTLKIWVWFLFKLLFSSWIMFHQSWFKKSCIDQTLVATKREWFRRPLFARDNQIFLNNNKLLALQSRAALKNFAKSPKSNQREVHKSWAWNAREIFW